MNVATNTVAFFRLKDAQSYRFWNRNGLRMLDVTKGQVLSAKTKEDADYFRARPDVLVECNEEGVALGQLGQGEIDTGKSKTYKVWGRAAQAMQPQRVVQPTPSQMAQQPTPPDAVPYGTRVEANPEAAKEQLAIPPDPMSDVPLPTANVAAATATPPIPADQVGASPIEASVESAEAPAAQKPTALDPFVGMSDAEKLTLQKQRIAAGFAPDMNLPIPDHGDPMIAAIEKQMSEHPELQDSLQPLLDTAKATAMAKLQRVAAAGGLPLRQDPHRRPEAPRGSLLEELKNEAQSGKLNSPVEFANHDGTTDALSGR